MKKTLKNLILLFVLGIAFISCDELITYPSISENASKEYHPGQFVWHDLVTPNPKVSMDFYEKVFGWTFTSLGSGETSYFVIHANEKKIGGITKLAPENGTVATWISSISVPNVEEAVAYNEKMGGKTFFKAMSIKGRGKTALVQDPQGAIVSFINSSTGDPALEIGKTWLWNELWSTDLEASLNYYKGLVNYSTEKIESAKVPYYAFKNESKKLSGVMKNPVEEMRTAWVPYIKTNNLDAQIKKIQETKAFVIMEPREDVRGGSVAVIQDPTGAVFALQVFNK
jgi:hypothetical protein